MKYADDGERIRDLDVILERVTEVATLFDDDGLSIRAINRSGSQYRKPGGWAQHLERFAHLWKTSALTHKTSTNRQIVDQRANGQKSIGKRHKQYRNTRQAAK